MASMRQRHALDGDLRQAITAAVNEIDQALEKTPQTFGESREGTERIGFVHPLGCRFEVDVPGRTVRILQVWVYARG